MSRRRKFIHSETCPWKQEVRPDMPHRALWGGPRAGQEPEEQGESRPGAFIMAPTVRKGGGWVSRVRVGWWRSFSGLWQSLVVWSWSWDDYRGKCCLPRYENRVEEVAHGMGTGLVSLCVRATCCSSESAALGDAASPQPGSPQLPELQECRRQNIYI